MAEKKKAPVEQLKKISPKTVMEKDVKGIPNGPLFTVIGVANDTKVVSTGYGESVGLKGEFVAVRAADKKQFMSNVCYLPEHAILPIVAALKDDSNDVIEFALEISKNESEKAATGYEYGVAPLVEVKSSNRLAALVDKIGLIE